VGSISYSPAETRLPIHVDEDPRDVVVRGAGRILTT